MKTDGNGPGVGAERAMHRRLWIVGGINMVVATGFVTTLIMVRRDGAASLAPYPPEAGVAAAILLPVLTLMTMWITLKWMDEVVRRLVLDSWAIAFVATLLGMTSWQFLIMGGVVAEPPVQAVFGMMLMGAGATVLASAFWLRWRRF